MKLCDIHTHTYFSNDGMCTVDDMCRAALEKGLHVLGISEHYDFDTRGGMRHYHEHEAERKRAMAEAAREYDGRLSLLCGIEIGQPHLWPDQTRAFIADNNFDYIIGSIHDVRDGTDIYHYTYTTMADCDYIFEKALNECVEIAKSGMIDILGHYDYPIRVMSRFFSDTDGLLRYRGLIGKLLRALVDSNVALEINTNGYKDWRGAHTVEPWLLEDYKKAGGQLVTLGSDAHCTRHLAVGLDEARRALRQAGFDRVTVFRQRKPEYISI